jgi:hypothetical protein
VFALSYVLSTIVELNSFDTLPSMNNGSMFDEGATSRPKQLGRVTLRHRSYALNIAYNVLVCVRTIATSQSVEYASSSSHVAHR